MRIEGTAAVVTGAAVGSGRAIARRLADSGSAVVLADIDLAGAGETKAAIEQAGGRAEIVAADFTKPPDIERLMDIAEGVFPEPIRILVNNAGGGGHIPPHFPDASPDQWGALLDLNLRGPMLATQRALPVLRAAGGGAVINVASTAGLGYGPYQSPEYGAAKAGLIRFTTTLAPLRERMNIRVNCVVPDWLATDRAVREIAELPATERENLTPPIPMDEFTDAVLGLIGNDDLAGKALVLRPGEPATLLNPPPD
jgi:NAD(P)-dependent dehydrogenase (short-subunit alcohol dehydrogenase family)